MTFADIYQHAWFADLTYVKWDITNTTSSAEMQVAAEEAKRIPKTLGEKIFKNLSWSVAHFQPDTDTGFAASLYVQDGSNEKVFAIRGTSQPILDVLAADFSDIGDLVWP